jgi:Amt family ammonium transporter
MLSRLLERARRQPHIFYPAMLAAVLLSGNAEAATPGRLDSGNTAWVLAASALVLFMTLPGLALFYGGLVRARNLLSVLMHCFVIGCIVSILWVSFGYSLALGRGNALIGSFARVFLAGADGRIVANGLPEAAYALFQMTFAVITPALIVAGAVDFAGGIVVHTTAGVAALVAAILAGAREGFPHRLDPPHSPGLTMAGAGMLWVGWFGFNGGSALAADATAAGAILATQLAAAAAGLTWIVAERLRFGKSTSVGIATGCVAGLATITPASGFVGAAGAVAIGIAGGVMCFFATALVKHRLRIDDSLDVFAVHGVGGMAGSLLVAVFAAPALGGGGYARGMDLARQLAAQAAAVAAAALWSAAATYVIVRLADMLVGVRVSREEESDGLDLATHGERAYDLT